MRSLRPFQALISTLAGILSVTSVRAADDWPALPEKAFVANRPATQEDVDAGRAVFALARDGVVIGKPLDITVPQFALMNNEPPTSPTKVVVVQAEEFEKGKLLGVRDTNGKEYAVQLSDVTLLGQSHPTAQSNE